MLVLPKCLGLSEPPREPTELPFPPTPALPSPGHLPTVLPGALQPQLPGPEDKGLQDRWRRKSGGGQARVLPDLSLQRRGAGPMD